MLRMWDRVADRLLNMRSGMRVGSVLDVCVPVLYACLLVFSSSFRQGEASVMSDPYAFLSASLADVVALSCIKGGTLYYVYASRGAFKSVVLVIVTLPTVLFAVTKLVFVSSGSRHGKADAIVLLVLTLIVAFVQCAIFVVASRRLKLRMAKYLLIDETSSRDSVAAPASPLPLNSLGAPNTSPGSMAGGSTRLLQPVLRRGGSQRALPTSVVPSASNSSLRKSPSETSPSSLCVSENAASATAEPEANSDSASSKKPSSLIMHVNKEGASRVLAGTFEALVLHLTDEHSQDPVFVKAFILTYRSFTDEEQFLNALINRFEAPINEEDEPEYPDSTARKTGRSTQKKHIRVWVWYVLKMWLEMAWDDIVDKPAILSRFQEFTSDVIAKKMPGPSATLSNIISSKLAGNNSSNTPLIIRRSRTLDVDWSNNNNLSGPLAVLSIPVPEFVRQITLFEFNIYKKIRPFECLGRKDKTTDVHSHLMDLVHRFNKTSQWIVTQMVTTSDLTLRIQALDYFVRVAVECKKQQNYNGLMEVVSSLQSAPVSRLKLTWQGLSQAREAEWQEFTDLLAGNFKELRRLLEGAPPPCLPYVGIFMTDLTFIQENQDFVNGGLINFEKRYLAAAVIARVQQNQQKPFPHIPIPALQTYIEKISLDLLSSSEAFQKSLQIEPRESHR